MPSTKHFDSVGCCLGNTKHIHNLLIYSNCYPHAHLEQLGQVVRGYVVPLSEEFQFMLEVPKQHGGIVIPQGLEGTRRLEVFLTVVSISIQLVHCL